VISGVDFFDIGEALAFEETGPAFRHDDARIAVDPSQRRHIQVVAVQVRDGDGVDLLMAIPVHGNRLATICPTRLRRWVGQHANAVHLHQAGACRHR
jgi:hypothetical protein